MRLTCDPGAPFRAGRTTEVAAIMMTFDDLQADVAARRIDTVVVAMVDMQGRLVGKRFDAEFFVAGGYKETYASDYLLAVDTTTELIQGYKSIGWHSGYGDFVLKPDLKTIRRTPWLTGTALVLCDVVDPKTGEDVPHSPRAILKKQLSRLSERRIKSVMASELEFFVFDETYESAGEKGYQNLKTAGRYIEDYHILETTKKEPLLRAIRMGLRGAGIEVENSKGEWGPGQSEINVRYASALEMADNHAFLKNACKEIAFSCGKAITFMAKWAQPFSGSSCHIHQSIWDMDEDLPLFFDASAAGGMSGTMKSYLAGQLKHAAEYTYFLAPYMNSYRRLAPGSFAPTQAVWSFDNRSAGYRICGANTSSVRIECRTGGADLNPYLAFAALVAAGIAGLESSSELEPALVGNAYDPGMAVREIPRTLRDATEQLDRSAFMRKAFGNDVVDHYVNTARWEQLEYDRKVVDLDLRRGFEQY